MTPRIVIRRAIIEVEYDGINLKERWEKHMVGGPVLCGGVPY